MRKLNEIFSKSTLKNMALKIVHYALVALVLAVCVAYLYWRWRRVNNQNKALEAELKLIQPYNNMSPLPADLPELKPAAAAPVVAQVSAPTVAPVVPQSPPVLTPKALAPIEESDDDDEPEVGVPPTIAAQAAQASPPTPQAPAAPVMVTVDTNFQVPADQVLFTDLMSVMSMMPPEALNETLAGSSITELPDEPAVPAEAPAVDLEDKAEPATRANTTRRRRK